jgi:transposase
MWKDLNQRKNREVAITMAVKKRPERDNRHWTEEEDDLLLELIGTSNYNSIGSRLKRSPQAVEKRLQDLGTSDKYLLTGMMSASELASHVKRDKMYVINLIKKHGLPAMTNSLNYKGDKKVTYYFIQAERFWSWAEKNRDKLNFAEIEEGAILPEPNWLEAQRRIDYYKPITRKKWSDKDEKRAVELLQAGYTHQQVADVFKRSKDSMKGIVDKYNLARPRKNWTTEEKKVVVDLIQSGKSFQEVADSYKVTRTTIYNIYQRNKNLAIL